MQEMKAQKGQYRDRQTTGGGYQGLPHPVGQYRRIRVIAGLLHVIKRLGQSEYGPEKSNQRSRLCQCSQCAEAFFQDRNLNQGSFLNLVADFFFILPEVKQTCFDQVRDWALETGCSAAWLTPLL